MWLAVNKQNASCMKVTDALSESSAIHKCLEQHVHHPAVVLAATVCPGAGQGSEQEGSLLNLAQPALVAAR